MFSNPDVIVPWDFSSHARRALEFARQITACENIRVICVLEEPNPYEPGVIWGIVSKDMAREKCEEHFFELIDKDDFPGLTLQIVFGDPATEINRFALDRRADLILIPSHGRTGLKRLMLGSVAEKVVRTAGCSVLLLPDAWINDHHSADVRPADTASG